MASLTEAEEALRSTYRKSNFQRLTRLLVRGGAMLLRETFDAIHSPDNLSTTLSNQSVRKKLKSARLTIPQWKRLYPSPGVYGTSNDFDISLTFKLLRTICNLTPPHTGWDKLPNDSDHSLEADLVRIKYYRNDVYGHSNDLEIPDDQFINLWKKISKALLRIASSLSPQKRSNWKKAIERFFHEPLTPWDERCADEAALYHQNYMIVMRMLHEFKEKFRGPKDDEREVTREAFVGIYIESIVPRGEPDIWKGIMACQNSFRLLFEYLANNLAVFVEDIELGSLTITVKCSSLQILEGLWKVYITGRLNKVVQETLVTDTVLENLGLGEVKLNVFISEDEYESEKQIFMENLEASEQSLALEEQKAQDSQDQPSIPRYEVAITTQEKQSAMTKRCATTTSQTDPLVILIPGKEIVRERVFFDPDVGKLVSSKITCNSIDRAVALDMNKAGTGGYFVSGFSSLLQFPKHSFVFLRVE